MKTVFIFTLTILLLMPQQRLFADRQKGCLRPPASANTTHKKPLASVIAESRFANPLTEPATLQDFQEFAQLMRKTALEFADDIETAVKNNPVLIRMLQGREIPIQVMVPEMLDGTAGPSELLQ